MGTVAQLVKSELASASSAHKELFNIIASRSFREGEFVLSSGKKSNLYFNMKPTMMTPRGAELAAKQFIEIAERCGAEYLGGLEMGAVPVIGSIAAVSSIGANPIHTFFVRKQPKVHGTKDLIEGLGPDESLDGKQVLIIDDVATSGKSILRAIDAAQKAGGIVEHAACLVDRDEGGHELLADKGIKLHSIFSAHEFIGSDN